MALNLRKKHRLVVLIRVLGLLGLGRSVWVWGLGIVVGCNACRFRVGPGITERTRSEPSTQKDLPSFGQKVKPRTPNPNRKP